MPATESQTNFQKTDLFEPIVLEFDQPLDVAASLTRFVQLPYCLLLESSTRTSSPNNGPLGRYSFLVADPFAWSEVPVNSADPFASMRETFAKLPTKRVTGLPPFQGGWAGLLGYDLNLSFEDIAAPKSDEFKLPAIAAGWYDTVVAWDHNENRTYIISQGFPETAPGPRRQRARQRLDFFRQLLESDEPGKLSPASPLKSELTIPEAQLVPEFTVPGPVGLTSNFSREAYIAAVEKAIEYIYAGDVFQINLAQRLLFPSQREPVALYQRLRERNPAPFSAFFDMGNAHLLSASPERFISVRDGIVETRPIKGTRRRTRVPQVDLAMKSELRSSEKDRAENVMIVDLMRNDLSRVCEDDSIEVTQLCQLEQYESVLHLVSAVQGRLKGNSNVVDLLEAVFPGGSITGAPKVRAMEIISELEPTSRGAYCGSLGYVGFDGSADFNILIRTMTDKGGWLQIPVGGGIVAQSNPEKEYEETWTKAAGMLRALSDD